MVLQYRAGDRGRRIDLSLVRERASPLDKARQYWHLEESGLFWGKVWFMSDLTSLSDVDWGSLLQRELTAFPVAEKKQSILSLRQDYCNKRTGTKDMSTWRTVAWICYGSRVADLVFWNKGWHREQERLYGKERLTVNHTGLGLDGLILVVWRWQRDWEIANRTKKHCSSDFVCKCVCACVSVCRVAAITPVWHLMSSK